MIRHTLELRPLDWEIHRLTRMEVRLQQEDTSDFNSPAIPTVEEMLGIHSTDKDLRFLRKKALEKVSDLLYRKKTGRAGEEMVAQTLQEIILPADSYVLRNVSMTIRHGYRIEIDAMILSPAFALILEVKNIAGTLFFKEEEGKTIRVQNDGRTDEFDCHIHQLDRQLNGLMQYFHARGIRLPVYGAVVLANQNTRIKQRPNLHPVIYRKQLARFYRSLTESAPVLPAGKTARLAEILTSRELQADEEPLCRQLEYPFEILRKGVLCLECNQKCEAIRGAGWRCPGCKKPGREAVRQGVEDLLILGENQITNALARDFLEIRSNSMMSILLSELDLLRTGKPPATSYRRKHAGPIRFKEDIT